MTQAPAHPILAAYQALAKDVRALDRLQREIGFEIARKSQANPNGLKVLGEMLRDAGMIARRIAARIALVALLLWGGRLEAQDGTVYRPSMSPLSYAFTKSALSGSAYLVGRELGLSRPVAALASIVGPWAVGKAVALRQGHRIPIGDAVGRGEGCGVAPRASGAVAGRSGRPRLVRIDRGADRDPIDPVVGGHGVPDRGDL